MKLEKILGTLNSFEKNSFIKVLDGIISEAPDSLQEINTILAEKEDPGLKHLDNEVISQIFNLVAKSYSKIIKNEFVKTSSQLDIIVELIIRDGNCIMKQDWFAHLYEAELEELNKKIEFLKNEIDNPKSKLSTAKKRDIIIYKACVDTAYNNDLVHNRESKITEDELSILLTLSEKLELSLEEIKLINYMIVRPKRIDIDLLITELKNSGLIFYSKKTSTIYVADEVVKILRDVTGKEIADKFFRRVLRLLKDSQINFICRRYEIDWKVGRQERIKAIINNSVPFRNAFIDDCHKDGTNLTDKKNFLKDLWSNGLKIEKPLKGKTIEEKMNHIIEHFSEIERDEKVGISVDGYEKLLFDLKETLPHLNQEVKEEFELQDEDVMKSSLLLNYNIKPRDILEIILPEDLEQFCVAREFSKRGNKIDRILDGYRDSENLYIENFENIGFRNLNALKENGIIIKEAELGIKFETLTKSIFTQLGLDVDEKLRKKINTSKDQIDIVINLGNDELILIECKTVKESGYNKFSSVSRQMKSYRDLTIKNNLKVVKSLLVAPDFSDDFINETELEYDLNLSLITANSLMKILDGFKNSIKHTQFPYKLLMRDVLINEERIIKAMSK
jgi:hypothetical protein